MARLPMRKLVDEVKAALTTATVCPPPPAKHKFDPLSLIGRIDVITQGYREAGPPTKLLAGEYAFRFYTGEELKADMLACPITKMEDDLMTTLRYEKLNRRLNKKQQVLLGYDKAGWPTAVLFGKNPMSNEVGLLSPGLLLPQPPSAAEAAATLRPLMEVETLSSSHKSGKKTKDSRSGDVRRSKLEEEVEAAIGSLSLIVPDSRRDKSKRTAAQKKKRSSVLGGGGSSIVGGGTSKWF